ncbi:hypothetical protein N7462_002134 [Penicillium macrosclerotiorum]|uniref:uncharacterized protein n=1 Tax=Penicillium macrosclerotiorum TaxID=303699 RepID=UPI002546FFAD|nr:uncharacterized protein N7462_002134 [Penicillium macrosclerotiorum]KAJ5692711.1 hypothetical protein N7462_002134 [Penicillium macrosclerotiorum]
MGDLTQLKGTVYIPDPSTPLYKLLSRWSDTGVIACPAVIVVPESEDDIKIALAYARENKLQVFPAGGGHGSFVPITSRTLYLDLKKFDQVQVNRKAQTVTVGGGAVTAQLIKTCTAQGFFTTWANSNTVGVVGSMLGGGIVGLCLLVSVYTFRTVYLVYQSNSINPANNNWITRTHDRSCPPHPSHHRWGDIAEVGPFSTGEHLALFHALCGAGNGLGVITALTMKIFPLADLDLSPDGVWVRRLIFPAPAIDVAADTFNKLHPLPPAMALTLLNARAPPTAPQPGAPMIILTVTYYGSSKHGEQAASLLFEAELVSQTITAQTMFTPMVSINDSLEPLNAHGGFKDVHSAWIRSTKGETIQAAFTKWLDFTTTHEDATHTTLVLSSCNPQKRMEIAETAEGQARFFDHRDRGIQAIIVSWVTNESTQSAATNFADEIKALYRQNELPSDPPRTILNNLGPSTKLEELHTADKIEQLRKLARVWDPSGIFWQPWDRE